MCIFSTPKSRSARTVVRLDRPFGFGLGCLRDTSSILLISSISGKKWFDCVECHEEQENHPLAENFEMIFACKKCRKCFRKDAREFEEADEFCPHCDNHFIIEAKTPKAALTIESDDVRMDSKMLRDDRAKPTGYNPKRTIFDPSEDADKLG
ncbi:hypothetical protein G7046_g8088 [Stylonectria norvegica]|nr:hypothetical protein G7046_g8088 [Stylonectria norvegica]